MDSRRPPFTANLAALEERLAMLRPLRRRRLSHEPDATTEPRPADETLQVETWRGAVAVYTETQATATRWQRGKTATERGGLFS